MNCPNCGAVLNCSCKLRTASDGKRCCTMCVAAYEINKNKPRNEVQTLQQEFVAVSTLNPNGTNDPVIVGVEVVNNAFNNFEK